MVNYNLKCEGRYGFILVQICYLVRFIVMSEICIQDYKGRVGIFNDLVRIFCQVVFFNLSFLFELSMIKMI